MFWHEIAFPHNHIQSIISFYHPICSDDELGGYIN